MITKLVKTTIIIIGLMISSVVSATPILWVGDSSGQLGTVDVATGNVNVIGNMGATMTDIAFDQSGNLYGITFGSLYSINTSTAAATLIGNHSLGGSKNSLVFDASGTLYAANSSLFTLNTLTGASSLVGNGGDAYSSSGDLAFINNELFLSSSLGSGDTLVGLNTSTGAGTIVGSIGYSAVYGLATDNNVDLYGLAGTSVLNIDTLTGAGSFLVDYSGQGLGAAWGSAFYEESGASVPEPSVSALLATGLLGVFGMARRKTRT